MRFRVGSVGTAAVLVLGFGGTATAAHAQPAPVRRPPAPGDVFVPLRAPVAPTTTSGNPAYRSRPDLHPPRLDVRHLGGTASPGLLLATPLMLGAADAHAGALVYDDAGQPVFFAPAPPGRIVANLTRINYRGHDALTWFEGVGIAPSGAYAGEWRVVDTAYRPIGVIRAGNGLAADLHDVQVNSTGTRALLDIYRPITRDLSAYGGSSHATVLEAVVQEVDLASGAVTWQWNSLEGGPLPGNTRDAVPVTDSYTSLKDSSVDYFHINSVEYDRDGNIIVSGRHISAILKISRSTGAVLWRFGGKRSSFRLTGDTGPSWQHDARRRSDGTVGAFDNGNSRTPPYSRGAAWRLDESAHTATLARQWRHDPDLFGGATGSSRELPSGHQLVSFGTTGVTTEYAGSTPVWESGFGNAGELSYRTLRTTWHARPAAPPVVVVDRSGSTATAYASWNGATDVTGWDLLAGPDASSLRVVGSARRTGFETTITGRVSSTDVVFRARANVAGAASAVSAPYRPQIAVRGSDGAVWTNVADAGWHSLGGRVLAPPAVAYAGGTPYYFVVGTDANVWVRTPTLGWHRAGPAGTRCSGLAAAVVGSSFELSCTGSDGALWRTRGDVTSDVLPVLDRWTSLGGRVVGGPAEAVVAGTLTYFVTGTGGYAYHRTAFAGWAALPGWRCTGSPAAATDDTGTATWACPGTDRALWYAVNSGGVWTGAHSLGGAAVGTPAIAAAASAPTFYVEGTTQSVYRRTFATGWASLGGRAVGGVGGAG